MTLRGGKPISNAYLVHLLTNPFYSGMMRWKNDIYQAAHPSIVSAAVFEQVQRILKGRSRTIVRRPTKLLLTGLADCAACGLLMGGDEHGRWKYYRCRGSFKSFERCRSRYCNLERVYSSLERVLETAALSALGRTQLLRLLSQATVERIRARESARAVVRSELAVLQQREEHLTRAFTEGLLTSDGYRRALTSLAQARDELKSISARSDDNSGAGRFNLFRSAIAGAHTAWDVFVLLTHPEQRLLVQQLFERLELDPTGVVRHVLRAQTAPPLAA